MQSRVYVSQSSIRRLSVPSIDGSSGSRRGLLLSALWVRRINRDSSGCTASAVLQARRRSAANVESQRSR